MGVKIVLATFKHMPVFRVGMRIFRYCRPKLKNISTQTTTLSFNGRFCVWSGQPSILPDFKLTHYRNLRFRQNEEWCAELLRRAQVVMQLGEMGRSGQRVNSVPPLPSAVTSSVVAPGLT